MKLDEIKELWAKDCIIDETELSKESLRLPKLHSKYYSIMLEEKSKLIEYENRLNKARKYAWMKYKGYLSREELNGVEPFQIELSKKDDVNLFIDADEEIIKYNSLVRYAKLKVEFLDSVLRQIGSMQFTIKNSIDFIKIMSGIV